MWFNITETLELLNTLYMNIGILVLTERTTKETSKIVLRMTSAPQGSPNEMFNNSLDPHEKIKNLKYNIVPIP